MQTAAGKARRPTQRAVLIVITILAYVIAGYIGVEYATVGADTISAIWPASGIATACVYLGGYWMVPGVLIGSALVNMHLVGVGYSPATDVITVLVMASGAAAEAFFGAWVMRRFSPGQDPFANVRGTLVFFFYGTLGGSVISASIGSLALVAGGLDVVAALPEIWFTWWVGDAVGILVMTPFLLLWLTHPLRRLPGRLVAEAAIFVLLFTILTVAIFSLDIPLSFLVLALLGWLAFRYGRRASALGIVVSTAVAIAATAQGRTIFLTDSPAGSLLLLQTYILSTTFPILVLATAMYERQGMQRVLEGTNLLLEQRVKERTAQLAEALEQAESAMRARSLFVAEMAHEFRTPLAAMAGYGDLLLDGYLGELTDEQRHAARQINQSAQRLHHLINDTISLSRIEAGSLELKPTTVSPRVFVDEIIDTLKSLALRKNLALDAQIDDSAPEQVMVDVARLQQVVINLAGNALKFTDSGSVTVLVSGMGERWALAVRDTGVGIPPDSLEQIFHSFTRLERSPEQTMPEGSGLGLAITRQLVTLMGGDIRVESQVGRGSTFTVTLPVSGVPATPVTNDESESRE
ncbi:MAG: MASE1 domain-containing protein [Pleurocapsa minor GSE-CHR-MK-17-07R]|jgi:signal transduction histidine kinase|nr:MASE1 domain-containing protein [Pleurocapsa minor GSE-CHR-MK 17-07R]